MELLLVENVWCQKQSWSLMHLLCSVMVGFGLRRNFPPPKDGEVLALYISESERNSLLSVQMM